MKPELISPEHKINDIWQQEGTIAPPVVQRQWHSAFVIVLIMCSINFFEFQPIKGSIFRYMQFGYLLVAILMSIPYLFLKKGGFVLPVQLIFFSVLLSVFIATYNWDQKFIDSLGGTVPVLVWGVFFYLNYIEFPVDRIEKIVVCYGLLYLIFYFFQFTHPNVGYFIKLETIDTSRGILRIVFPGRGLFYLTTFIAINRMTTSSSNLWLWAALSAMGVIVTVMQVTRQFIFAAAVIYLIHFLLTTSWLKRIAILISALVIAVYILNSDSVIVASMKDTQEQNQELGAEYVRVQGALFYLTEFSKTEFSRIFGNGVPYGDNSSYNKYYSWLLSNYGYWLSDVGLVAVYAMFGLFAVFGYILIWGKSFFISVPRPFLYLKYYLWFLLLTCLTSDTVYSSSDLIATVLVIYMYQVIYERRKLQSASQIN